MNFQVAGNISRLLEESESGKERDFAGTCFAAGAKGTEVVFPEDKAVLAETQSVTFLISTEMKKSTKHF